jgi:CheY-like chemotaxis protein
MPPSKHPSSLLSGLRILVVEDDADARELVAAILEGAGAIVEAVESAAAGFAAMRSFRPQLLVSDISMPDEDGYSLIRRVRALAVAEGGDIPSIALTAYTRIEDRAKALRAGFNLHMGKPVRPVDLVSAVKTLATGPN